MTMQHNHYDVIVAGGGLAGCAAAVSSAKHGAKTLLIEKYGMLGGWATLALVNPFMSHRTTDSKDLVAGEFEDFKALLAQYGGLLANCFDPDIAAYCLQEYVVSSGSKMLLHSDITGASKSREGIFELETISHGTKNKYSANYLVDCTGDGIAAYYLGAEYESGGADGKCQAVTYMFDVGGVDPVEALTYVRDNPDEFRFPKFSPDDDPSELAQDVYAAAGYYTLVERAKGAGEYNVPGDIIFYVSRPTRGMVTFNTTHVGDIDPSSAQDMTRAETEGRRQMMEVLRFVRKYVPGMSGAYIARSASHIGVRETRRITGEYSFSEDDIASARKHSDSICRLAYPVDIHRGAGEGYTREEESEGPVAPPDGDWYEIPFRCLQVKGKEDLLVAGRCVSSTHAGHGAIRIMPACMAMGQAAGTASALALRKGCRINEIDISELRKLLIADGAII